MAGMTLHDSPDHLSTGELAGGLLTGDQLAAVFARMSGLLLSADKVSTALKLVTSLAAEVIPDTSGAGFTVTSRDGERVTAAATDGIVERADLLQYELGYGPCLTAWRDQVVVRIDDLATDERWPTWSRQAFELGLRASLSVPLVAGTRPLGALKVYAVHPSTLGQREEHVLTMFAAQAAMFLANMRAADDAERAAGHIADSLRGREVIILAKGIIMARDEIDERTAFLTLAHIASQQRVTLRQAAERLTQSTVRRRR
jgi:GAF domain-containing protein